MINLIPAMIMMSVTFGFLIVIACVVAASYCYDVCVYHPGEDLYFRTDERRHHINLI